MVIATDVPLVAGGLLGWGLVFVVLGYFVRRGPWLLTAELMLVAGLVAAIIVLPSGYEFDTRSFLALLLIPTMLALLCSGLGVGIRSVRRPRADA